MWQLWWPCPGLGAQIAGGGWEMGIQSVVLEGSLSGDDGAAIVTLQLQGPSVTWHHSRCTMKPAGL